MSKTVKVTLYSKAFFFKRLLWFQVTNVYLIDSSITGVGESPDPIMNDAPDTVLYLIENPS
jgi:hypothetical protein